MGRNLLYKILKMAGNCKIFVALGICLIHAQIYAQNEKAKQIFENINDTFSAKPSAKDHQFGEFFLLLIAGAVLIFVIWLAYQFYVQRKQNSSPDTAWGLYKKLCQVHNLSLKERYVIRTVCRWNELDDPLPLFVEPNFFKQVLADATMQRYHPVVHSILDKLFGHWHELSQHAGPLGSRPPEDSQDDNTSDHQQLNFVTKDGDVASDPSAVHLEQTPAKSDQEQLTSFHGTKVLLNPIPGRMAFSALVEPMSRLSTEIAAVSIQHNLTDGRGMNNKTFDGIGEQRNINAEPQSPLFPKSNVPSPNEMLASEPRRTDQRSPISSTPQYLRTHNSQRNNRREAMPKRDTAFENTTMSEAVVMGK